MKYAIQEQGRFLSVFTFPGPPMQMQMLEPRAIPVADEVNLSDYFWNGSMPAPIPAKPQGAGWNFDYQTGVWVNDLEAAMDAKWTQLKAKRTELEFGTFEYNNMVFDGDLDAQRRLSTYISISKTDPNFTAMFILANDSVVELTAVDFIAIEQAKAFQVAAAFAVGAQLRAQVYAATTLEEIESINWPTNEVSPEPPDSP